VDSNRKKIKILFISHSSYFNGAEICLLNLVENIDKDVFDPVVVFPEQGPLLDKIKSFDVRTYIVPLERWITYKFENPLKKTTLRSRTQNIMNIIDNESIDIVHTNTAVVLEGAIAAKIKGIPHVWHIHEFLQGHSELNAVLPLPFVYQIMFELSDRLVTVSNYSKRQFQGLIDEKDITVIYNGIEENNLPSDKNFVRNEFKFSNNDLVAVSVGLLSEAKGYDNLLKTAEICKDKGINVKFIWVGGSVNKTEKDFIKKTKKRGLEEKVFYLGFRQNIPELLRSSDLMICFSTMEAFPLSILEAMAAGLPVITTDCGGPAESVINNETGFIVPVNDPQKLSDKIIELSSSAGKRKLLGDNGLKRFEDNFSIKKYINSFELLYKETVNIEKFASPRELAFIESSYDLYETVSNEHWKKLKKKK
jgi:glycosyltransferase involved in cell wall biosynthesis